MLKDLLSTRFSKITSKHKNALWAVVIVLFSTVSFFSAQFVSVFIALIILALSGKDKVQAVDIMTDNHTVKLAVATMVGIITISLLVKFINKRGLEPKELLMLENKPSINNVIDVVLLYGLYFLSLIAVTIFLGSFTGVDVNQTQDLGIVRPDDFNSKLTLFLLIVVLPPVTEEILFRGFLFNMLKKHTAHVVAVILTCALFGAAHLEYDNLNWIAAIDTLIFSGFLIHISQKHQSLYSAMMLHAIKNSIAFYVLFVRAV